MNLHKMIEICLKDDNMHRFVMINASICINIYVITCINSMLSHVHRVLKIKIWAKDEDSTNRDFWILMNSLDFGD